MEFVFPSEDETVGALIQAQLAYHPRVAFVGFRMDEARGLVLRLQTDAADERELLRAALAEIRAHFAALRMAETRPGSAEECKHDA